MKILNHSFEYINPPNYQDILNVIEISARNFYQSDPKGDPSLFIKDKIKRGHESVLEFGNICLNVITDRGVMAEWTRHRIGFSYAIESTRYCNYNKDKFNNE